MFLKLFKKTEKLIQSTTLTEDELVKKIHDEVDSLEEKSIQAVENLLSSLNIPTIGKVNEKADLMKSLGFSRNNETIIQSENIKQDIEEKKRIKENNDAKLKLINDYRIFYPNDKIITFKEFEKVLYKYDLIYAPAKAYIKDVPEKNLIEIKKAKSVDFSHRPLNLHAVTAMTLIENIYSDTDKFNYLKSVINKLPQIASIGKKVSNYSVCTLPVSEQLEIAADKENGIYRFDKAKWSDWRKVSYDEYVQARSSGLLTDSYNTVECSKSDMYKLILEECNKIKKVPNNIDVYFLERYLKIEISKVDRSDLFIAAPKTHFDLENISSWNGKEFFMKQPVKITYVKDPIAFYILKGTGDDPHGFVRIVSKWGTSDDKSYLDPIVQDERMN